MAISSQPLLAPPPPPAPSTSPQNNAVLATAAVAAQRVAKPTATQTKRAAAAVAQGEASRENTGSAFVGRAYDNEAAAVEANTRRGPPRGRGDKVDVSV